ncbi:hypothetical protein ACJ72_08061, partial [Emergomyces africanus]
MHALGVGLALPPPLPHQFPTAWEHPAIFLLLILFVLLILLFSPLFPTFCVYNFMLSLARKTLQRVPSFQDILQGRMTRPDICVDVLVIGAGPTGLGAAKRLNQI